MATDLIRYDVLVQQALRSVVRKVLADATKDGLPGTHHFYISFDTNAPGVKITPRLHDMYPEEMTIVLQHQFWDLIVSDTHFEVSLSFEKIPERLFVPFDAITGFFDPSVKFGLKFEAVTVGEEESAGKDEKRKGDSPPGENGQAEDGTAEPPVQIGRKPRSKDKEAAPATPEEGEQTPPTDDSAPDGASAEVVSLDAFRKKK